MVQEEAPHRLLVEGTDDLHTVIHLMKVHGADWGDPPKPAETWLPYVQECNGISGVLKSIGAAAKTHPRLGIIVDANDDAQARFERVRHRLSETGVTPPSSLDEGGLVFNGLKPDSRVGIWVMPNNKLHGALEEFLSKLVPGDDACWAYAKEAAEEARREHEAPYAEKDAMKARVHTWLAWQKEPGQPFGTAMTAHYFDKDQALAQRFADWFRRVFAD